MVRRLQHSREPSRLRSALAALSRPALVLLIFAGATSAQAQLSPDAKKAWADYERLAPHKVFMLAPNGKAYFWTGATGEDPKAAVENGLKYCEDNAKAKCTIYAVNNVVLDGRDWKTAAPPALPNIGRLRPEPYWINKGPQSAAGLIVWSHGYFLGIDATSTAPQGQVANFTTAGYDLYRFDRQYINDWPGDATQLVAMVKQAKAMGYKRVVLAGQSAGAWVSMAATFRGAPVDGVISVSAAHHGEVKTMRDISVARSEWQQIVKGIKPGPRIAVFFFKDDSYDVGGRDEDAKAAFKASGVDSIVVGYPPGFTGHGAGNGSPFPRKYGACIHAFIETGAREAPCN